MDDLPSYAAAAAETPSMAGSVRTCSIEDKQHDYYFLVEDSANRYSLRLTVDPHTPLFRIEVHEPEVPHEPKVQDFLRRREETSHAPIELLLYKRSRPSVPVTPPPSQPSLPNLPPPPFLPRDGDASGDDGRDSNNIEDGSGHLDVNANNAVSSSRSGSRERSRSSRVSTVPDDDEWAAPPVAAARIASPNDKISPPVAICTSQPASDSAKWSVVLTKRSGIRYEAKIPVIIVPGVRPVQRDLSFRVPRFGSFEEPHVGLWLNNPLIIGDAGTLLARFHRRLTTSYPRNLLVLTRGAGLDFEYAALLGIVAVQRVLYPRYSGETKGA